MVTEPDLHVRLIQTADDVLRAFREVLKPQGLSEPQFNVLRILRGAGPEGLPCQKVAERMVTRLPDITRLLDRVEKAGWVERRRDATDRRVVLARLTRKGRALLARLDAAVDAEHRRRFVALSAAEREQLLVLLNKIRGS